MKKRLFAGVLLAALVAGFTAWYTLCVPKRVRADSLPATVLALLPEAARYEKQTVRSYQLAGVIGGAEGEKQRMNDFVTTSVNCYDAADRLIRVVMYSPDGEMPESYIEYQYDDAGRRTALISHNQLAAKDGSDIVNETRIVYGADGRAVSEEQHVLGSVMKTTYFYDEAGRKTGKWLSRDKQGREDGHGTFVCDEKDQIIRKEEVSGQFRLTGEYVYDEYGYIEQSVVQLPDRDPVTTRTERTYDEAGHPLTEATYENGALKTRTESEYDWDGRLERQIWYDAAGNITSTLECEQITQ
ncbi:hypothetical protein NE562_15475 [Butyricicoccus faecihominis]|uniref:hypothetical protein n=1 Tax=Butyricicoccus faecihominis TaxID=1712515 RepID=UPI00247AC8BD|nr:hypothetical protein [Butyricicoccus faecihominis]MCQ5131065.1 hypothetical protein [Butyricicoccus faecihominis]